MEIWKTSIWKTAEYLNFLKRNSHFSHPIIDSRNSFSSPEVVFSAKLAINLAMLWVGQLAVKLTFHQTEHAVFHLIWQGPGKALLAAYWKQDPFKFKKQTNKKIPCLQFQQINSSVLASFVEAPWTYWKHTFSLHWHFSVLLVKFSEKLPIYLCMYIHISYVIWPLPVWSKF